MPASLATDLSVRDSKISALDGKLIMSSRPLSLPLGHVVDRDFISSCLRMYSSNHHAHSACRFIVMLVWRDWRTRVQNSPARQKDMILPVV